MQVRAIAKSVRMSPRKTRLIADAIRKLTIGEALLVLEGSQKRASDPIAKALMSAVANAVTNNGLERDTLVIESVMVNEGQAMKRFHPSSRGRVHPYKKRSSHITIVLGQKVAKKTAAVVKADANKNEKAEDTQETTFVKKTNVKGGKK